MSDIPPELLDSYHRTTYKVLVGGTEADSARGRIRKAINLYIGRASAELDSLLIDVSASQWACLTAHNPHSTLLKPEENRKLQARLLSQLAARNYQLLPGRSVAQAGKWPDEDSALVFDIGLERARRIAIDFGQYGFLFGEIGSPARLVLCSEE